MKVKGPATSQQHLSVHLHGRLPSELSAREVGVVGRVDVVVSQGLVHLHVEVQSIQEHGCVLVRHQVSDETVFAHTT
ncbi:hypothetical protein NPIL_656761, partial [Nephila pilipes]